MKKSDYADFKAMWLGACELCPGKNPSEQSIVLAFGSLINFELADVKQALVACLRTSKFMPTVAEVSDWLMGGPVEDRARMAWTMVQESIRRLRSDTSVRFMDRAAMWAVKACGGWIALCRMSPSESEPLFCRYYVTAARQGYVDVPDHFCGNDELRSSDYSPWHPDQIQTIGMGRAVPMVTA